MSYHDTAFSNYYACSLLDGNMSHHASLGRQELINMIKRKRAAKAAGPSWRRGWDWWYMVLIRESQRPAANASAHAITPANPQCWRDSIDSPPTISTFVSVNHQNLGLCTGTGHCIRWLAILFIEFLIFTLQSNNNTPLQRVHSEPKRNQSAWRMAVAARLDVKYQLIIFSH